MSLQGTQDDDLLLYQIAKMYYVEGLSQDAIASKVSFSRSYVSRLLDRAKERRIVTFNVMNPMAETVDGLERHLAELFDLKFVSIEGVSAAEHHGKTGRTLNDSIARHAAAMLPGFLSTASTVTVGFGETLYRMSKELRAQKPQEALSFVPAVGTVSTASPQTQSNIIVDNLATAFGGRSFFTNVPVVTDRAESKSRLYQSHRSELLHQWELADAAIVGLGAPYRSSADPFSLNEATDEYRALVASSDIAGDILASFFFEDGSELPLGGAYTRNALPLSHLRQMDRVLCIAGGSRKVRGIWSALRCGFVNCLITDSETAMGVIALEEDG
uniref:sugar-binding transcriptional regulator n=1 Tax=Olsenella uli TaxID=133926 RepID=UPI0028E9D1E8|nr:sugar-binding domain-containing protein [Olsenella uli]